MELQDRSLVEVDPYDIPGLDEPDHEGWEQAYVAAESYFCSLGIQDRLLMAHLIGKVLRAAAKRITRGEEVEPATLVMEEARGVIVDWFQRVTGERLPNDQLESQSILALLLADMPGKWQQWFLRDSDAPEEFVTRLREAYVEAGPQFRKGVMTPQVLELGTVGSVAGKSADLLGRAPIIGRLVTFLFWTLVTVSLAMVLWGL